MKLPTFLILITLVVYSQGLSSQQQSDIITANKECQKETKVSKQLVDDIFNRKICDVSAYENNKQLREFAVCVDTKAGWLNQDGTYNTKSLKKWLQKGDLNCEEAEEAIKKCVVKKETLEDTSFHVLKCLYNIGV
ncbi:hypothetical protein Zmor_019598 [Zophobas morio]|uniref:Uncharacterized protein n=1 Tax=Zophobas morio TaxID=2755281 RepID=A0AA38M9L5_9CUCU|nr:hypothetical protein Zmor_019598 [Zophobas morio]